MPDRDPKPTPLSSEQVRHVAKLARLRLSDQQIDRYRQQLASVIEYIAKLNELDLAGVEPMAHPSDMTNRLDDDVIEPAMPAEFLFRNAPAVEHQFLAVPRVLDDDGGG